MEATSSLNMSARLWPWHCVHEWPGFLSCKEGMNLHQSVPYLEYGTGLIFFSVTLYTSTVLSNVSSGLITPSCVTFPLYLVYTLAFGHFSLIFLATPVMVPPVPAPSTTMSTLPENKTRRHSHIFSCIKWLKLVFSYCFKNDTKFVAFDRNLIFQQLY